MYILLASLLVIYYLSIHPSIPQSIHLSLHPYIIHQSIYLSNKMLLTLDITNEIHDAHDEINDTIEDVLKLNPPVWGILPFKSSNKIPHPEEKGKR